MRKRAVEAENPFWITYSDLLSSLFMVSVVLLFAFVGMATVMKQELEKKNQQLEEQRRQAIQKREEAEKRNKQVHKDATTFGDLLRALRSLEERFKAKGVKVDQFGDLEIPDRVLFKSNEANLLDAGKIFLDEFMPDYAEVVVSPQYEGIIQGVIFQGHADTKGPSDLDENYFSNMGLTTLRAQSVNEYILSMDYGSNRTKNQLRRLAIVAGRSNIEARLELLARGELKNAHTKDQDHQRKVKIRLLLKNPYLEMKEAK